MGRHSLQPNQAPAIPQAPLNDALPSTPAWADVDTKKTTSSNHMSSRRYGAVAALAAATAFSAVAVTSEQAATPAYAAVTADLPLQLVTELPDLSATFTLTVDGETTEITTEVETWGRALAEANVAVGNDDIVNVDLSDPVEDGVTVVIKRVTYTDVIEEDVVEFETVRENDPNLDKGEEVVKTEGRNGVTRTTYRVTLVDGEEESREQTIQVKESELVNRVISVGTKEPAPVVEETPAPATTQAPAETQETTEAAPAQPVIVNAGGAKGIAQQMVANKGWSNSEFQCLETLWQRESNWNHLASNPSSGAYGIPQALPGSKMASHGADWRTNPATQIAWGLDYIQGRYGTPCGALGHSYSVGWY